MAGPTFAGAELEEIRERGLGKCQVDGRNPGVHAHHRRPRGKGGSSAEDTNLSPNGLWLCARCHDWIESHRAVALDLGLLVAQGKSPLHQPAWLILPYGASWWSLTRTGPFRLYLPDPPWETLQLLPR